MEGPYFKNVILSVNELSVKKGGKKILNRISFELLENEILGIIGRNASGKTMLVNAILGFVPYKGRVFFSIKKKKLDLSRKKRHFMKSLQLRKIYCFLQDCAIKHIKLSKY